MKENKQYMSLYELEDGTIIADDIVLDGNILLREGHKLDNKTIDKLKDTYNENKILVYVKEKDEPTINLLKEKDLEEIEENFSEFSEEIENMFSDIDTYGKVKIDEVRKFTDKIRKDLNSPSTVIKSIVLHGSGEDVIFRHSVNVTALSTILGKWLGLNEKELKLLTYSAILHDFGKTQIDKSILAKTTFLDEEELKAMKVHPILAYNVVKQLQYIQESVKLGVLMHHERLDGSGYPLGLKEGKIHPFAKIIAIADTFDAVNSNRIYKKRKSPFKALEIIKEDSLSKLDYEYSKIFIEHITNYYIGEEAVLNSNERCKIIQIDNNNISNPLVLCNDKFVDLKKEKHLEIERLV